jgi:aspartate-semialdehyde dehydrogenase
MVGSVLMQRMLEERDFDHLEPTFFTTSNVGGKGPAIGRETPPLRDASDVKGFAALDAIVTCQGGDYSNDMLPKLRAAGWNGYWIDAASALRMKDDAVIILDPVNREVIDAALKRGIRNYIGGNCTVSLMMMALAGLFRHDVVEWMTCMTYQSASGAGAQNMRELLQQMGEAHMAARDLLQDPQSAILDIDREVAGILRDPSFPDRALRRTACRQPHPVDRQGHGRRPEPRGMERRRRNQQDPGPRSRERANAPFPSTRSACASARCAATAKGSRSS